MSGYQTFDDERRGIVSASAALFMARGYDNIALRDIAESLNMSNADLRQHFTSKTKLLIAVVADVADGIGRQWETEIKEGKGNAIAKMRRILPLHAQPVQSVILDGGRNGNAKLFTWLGTALAERLAPSLTGLIHQGCNEDVFRVQCPAECAQFILAGLQFLTHQGIRPWTLEEYMRRASAVPSMIEALLDAQPGSLAFLSVPLTTHSGQRREGIKST